jgi:hypothetical protein
VRRRRTPRLLHWDGAHVAIFAAAFGAPQPLLNVNDLRIPATNVCQEVRIRGARMRADAAPDDQLVLAEFIRESKNLEIGSHFRYCI